MQKIQFVSAQPDVPYFHWQTKLYVSNFIDLGIDPCDIHVIFGLMNNQNEPSIESKKLCNFGINVHYYLDNRINKSYIPSIKPYLISQWLWENPEFGELFFLHDADIIFRKLPNFDLMMGDDINYLSDTINYIGYDYIESCCQNYEKAHPNQEKNSLLKEMTRIVQIDVDLIKENQLKSGGGQYLLKNTNYDLWTKIYVDCVPLYKQMLNYNRRNPIRGGEIQFWTAEMWSLLWNLWKFGYQTNVTSELDFSWATDDLKTYESKPILHMAGVTENLKSTKFYKGAFIHQDPIKLMIENPNYFDYVDSNSATLKYVDLIRNFVQKYNNELFI